MKREVLLGGSVLLTMGMGGGWWVRKEERRRWKVAKDLPIRAVGWWFRTGLFGKRGRRSMSVSTPMALGKSGGVSFPSMVLLLLEDAVVVVDSIAVFPFTAPDGD